MAEQPTPQNPQAMTDKQALDAYLAGKDAIENPNKFGVDPTVVSTQGISSSMPVGLRMTPQVPQAPIGNPEFPQMGQIKAMPEVAKPGELAADKKPDTAKPDLAADTMKTLKDAFDLQKKGVIEGAAVGAEQAAAEATYLQDMVLANQEFAARSMAMERFRQDELEKKEKEIDGIKIDPNRKWNNASTEQKIGMGLGMILGGIGAAFTGGKNTVIDSINKMIEADTEAQKADLNKKQNLYSMMYKRFGDERAAEAASNLYKLQGIQAQLQQVQAQYKGQQAAANSLVAQGQIGERIAVEQAKFKEALGNSAAMQAQDQMLKKVLELPKEQREQGMKELSAYKEIQSSLNQVKDIYEDMGRLQTVATRLGSPVQSSAMMDTQKARIFPIIKSIMGEAIQEADVKRMIDPNLINFLDDEKTRMVKQQNLMKVLQSKMPSRTPLLSGMGYLPKVIEEGKAQ